MNGIIKYIIAIVGTLLLLGAIAYGIFFGMIFKMFDSTTSTKEIITEEWDTEGLREVTLFKLGGNATVNPGLHVVIHTVDENGKSGKEQEIFNVANPSLQGNEVVFKWQSVDTLLIEYQANTRIFKQESELTYVDSTLNFKIIYKRKK